MFDESGRELGHAQERIRAAIEAHGRLDLLGRIGPLLDERAQRDLRTAADERFDYLQDQNDELRGIWADLHAVGAQVAPDIALVCAQVDELLRSGDDSSVPPLQIIEAWLDRVKRFGRHSLDAEVEELRAQAVGLDEDRTLRVRAALDRRDYADAVRLMAGGSQLALPDAHRATLWRTRAQDACADVRASISRFDLPLAKRWIEGVSGNARADQPLSRLFAEYAVGDLREAQRTAPFSQVVSCDRIARRLDDEQQNPCFLPQLAAYGSLVISVPNTKVTDRAFARSAAALVASASRRYDARVLVLVLAPGLSAEARLRSLAEVRARGQHAAFIDDLDFYRVVYTSETRRPEPLLGLLELAFEQQPIDVVNPFGAHDGQAVRMEMYVGRRHEADALTSPVTTHYSRLFSGRKLGKSALLRFISESERVLPSGNRLHVIYVPIVGLESEHSVVARILESFPQSLAFELPSGGGDGAFERLDVAMRGFRAERPKESLLFVLDEADVFVESQLLEYEHGRERCLSFMMRTMVESTLDDRGIPVVRFLFSGYRATNTREGPWANWGDLLVLHPLEEKDAIDLVAGPLARLGIDVTAHGPSIAHRCGFQPAVLLRFGDVLLTSVGRRRTRGDFTRTIRVNHLDIAKTFAQEVVQEEIRAVARNNFQGNRTGFLVFNALLMVFATDGPNAQVEDLEDRIVDLLVGSDESSDSVDWSKLCEGFDTPSAFVRRKLDDFVERQLVTRHRQVDTRRYRYRLRFPHHLSTLLTWEPRQEIANLVRSLGEDERDRRTTRRSMISEDELEEIRDWCSQPAEIHEAFVVVSSWPQALHQSAGGIGERLGIVPGGGTDSDDCQIYVGLSPDSADELLDTCDVARCPPLIVGGPTILRWALQRRSKVERLLEIFGTGRMPIPTVEWWFSRVRGLEFEATNAFQTLGRLTRGIPFLVEKVDGLLLDGGVGGITISRGTLDTVTVAFGNQRQMLMDEFVAFADLSGREREILEMVCVASGDDGGRRGDGIGELLLPDLWPDFGHQIRALDFDDAPSVEYLMLLGSVPRVGNGRGSMFEDIASVADDDPIQDLRTDRA